MNRKRVSIGLLVTFGIVAGLIADRAISKSSSGQQVSSDRWEYCSITGVIWDHERRNHYAKFCYFRSSGCQETEIVGPQLAENEFGGVAIQKTLAKASATLGQNGWELVGEFSGYGDKDQHRLYFKRRQK